MVDKQTNFTMLRNVFRSLRSFGLNPRDWQVDRAGTLAPGAFAFQHRFDSDFRIFAEVRPQTVGELQALRVISL